MAGVELKEKRGEADKNRLFPSSVLSDCGSERTSDLRVGGSNPSRCANKFNNLRAEYQPFIRPTSLYMRAAL
jgi:hypothetical protein